MFNKRTRTYSLGMFLLGFLLICSVQSALAQDAQTAAQAAQAVPAPAASGIANGEKARIQGIVVHSEPGFMTVRDTSGTETVVVLSDRTDMSPHGTNACDKVCPGRCVKVEGRGNCCGQLVAEEVKFRKDDCNVCYFSENIEALKAQTAQLSRNDEALAAQQKIMQGRIDENTTTARTARAEAQAAQQLADAANGLARTANERISTLDDYKPVEDAVVTFKTGSSVLSKEDKEILDQFAAKARASKGYIITISGFTDSTGSEAFNNRLSDWRADAAMRYLVSSANVPAHRVQITYAGGETMPAESNQTRHGRSVNRRAVIRLLVSPALSNQTVTPTSTPTDH